MRPVGGLTPKFQFTHPVRGATQAPQGGWYHQGRFNSRTPCGVRQGKTSAPPSGRGFNSRTPCGVRPMRGSAVFTASGFQFTHPVRGATASPLLTIHTPMVSIHAPRAGCDHLRGAPRVALERVSIHAPRAGCDLRRARSACRGRQFQFTHPVRGATPTSCARALGRRSFNSRTPCGVRLPCASTMRRSRRFNSRTPCGVRHRVGGLQDVELGVSIHAPRAGCDHPPRGLPPPKQCFNSRTPCGVRPERTEVPRSFSSCFNSRTPCGVRHTLPESLRILMRFQFTHPVRGATSASGYSILIQ